MQTHHAAKLLAATGCVRLATVLRHVGCCCLKSENGQILATNTQHVATRWPNAHKVLRPAMLRYVALTCYDRLVGVLAVIRPKPQA